MIPTLPPGAPLAKSRRAQGVVNVLPISRRGIRRAIFPMLAVNKRKLYKRWLDGVPEKDLARMFNLRREEVELVLHEMSTTGEQAA